MEPIPLDSPPDRVAGGGGASGEGGGRGEVGGWGEVGVCRRRGESGARGEVGKDGERVEQAADGERVEPAFDGERGGPAGADVVRSDGDRGGGKEALPVGRVLFPFIVLLPLDTAAFASTSNCRSLRIRLLRTIW